jgi:hypothetical protein
MSDSEDAGEIPRPRNEIRIRDYERRQLTEYLPEIIELYEDRELADDDRDLVERFETMLDEFESEIDGTEAMYDMGADNWRDLATALDELDDSRASWLRAKIGRRAELPTVQMGFTTTVPFMALATGEDPVRPDRTA